MTKEELKMQEEGEVQAEEAPTEEAEEGNAEEKSGDDGVPGIEE